MITSRPYRDAADLQRLIRFLIAARAQNPLHNWHVGDLIWRMFYSSRFDPAQNVRLWEADGAVVGFGWLYPPNGADLIPGDPKLLPEMVHWAESAVTEGSLYLATLDTDSALTASFESQGYWQTETYGLHLRRRLDDDLPAAPLPSGFSLRPVAGESEAAARAQLHRTAFDSQAVTDDGYRNVIRAPLYQPELDLVAVAPDGSFAAFCLGWLDEANRVGLFEPVGTHPDFRRMGLARAVMLEVLVRMRARGMATALITSSAENVASRALYAGLGFGVESRQVIYSR